MQDALLQNTDVMQKIVRWYAEGGWMTSVEAQQCAFDRILEEAGRGTGGEEVELEDSGMARYVWFR